MPRAINESQWIIRVSGYTPAKPLYFSGKTGGEKSASTGAYNDGINRINKKLVGNYSISDLALTRAFESDIDTAFIRFLDDYCNVEDGDLVITVQAIDNCSTANPIGEPFEYVGVQFLGYSLPDIKRDGGDTAAIITYNFCADDLQIG